jgi:hypothetical protein
VAVVDLDKEVVLGAIVLSLQPNQPGVLHVLVLDSDVDVMMGSVDVVVAGAVVEVSSRQPHQPGVLQVSVLVLVRDVGVGADDVVVVVVLVPSSNFQRKQSTHVTSSSTHVAALSYFMYTLSMAYRRRCVVVLGRQPQSLTTSYAQRFPVWQIVSKA